MEFFFLLGVIAEALKVARAAARVLGLCFVLL
jgi:hypothetical protein